MPSTPRCCARILRPTSPSIGSAISCASNRPICSRQAAGPSRTRRRDMPIATPEIYAEMLNRAKAGAFAYPAINVSSSQTLNAALKGFADAGSDGIIQVSTGGASYLSGARLADMVVGASALAEYAHVVAARYPINIALHTDHCPKNNLDKYVRPLIKISQERVARGQGPLFQSHMWDGSAVGLKENLEIAPELLGERKKAKLRPAVEIGGGGGAEDR